MRLFALKDTIITKKLLLLHRISKILHYEQLYRVSINCFPDYIHLIRENSICLIFMDPFIVDYSVEIPKRCSFVIEFIIPKLIKGSINFGIINSITKQHLVGTSTE